ncbi:cytochrome b562 [Marinomonas transparens]|uniref:Cytochrome b562 n=1 Tax=Marinomonas transparens TaxID=2795388 RepID=A0A934N1Y6_9GAMM|nr:cytochrome b562 [Marinomonas transparens]MBJ7539980.1 hypothetical protein [Marinomonas transparens]
MNKMFFVSALMALTLSSGAFAHGSCDESTLHGYMQDIKSDLRAVSKAVKSGENGDAITHLDSLISAFEKSREEMPYQFKAEGLKGNELTIQTAAYHKVVDDTLGILNELEGALKANDSAKVKKMLGAMGQQRKIGHSNFKQNC